MGTEGKGKDSNLKGGRAWMGRWGGEEWGWWEKSGRDRICSLGQSSVLVLDEHKIVMPYLRLTTVHGPCLCNILHIRGLYRGWFC